MMTTDTKPNYANLKHREKELLAQLAEVKEELKIAENQIIEEKLNTALQCLAEVDEMTSRYYRCSIDVYCEECEQEFNMDIDLAEIICALQQLR